jgi:hypothetical protein
VAAIWFIDLCQIPGQFSLIPLVVEYAGAGTACSKRSLTSRRLHAVRQKWGGAQRLASLQVHAEVRLCLYVTIDADCAQHYSHGVHTGILFTGFPFHTVLGIHQCIFCPQQQSVKLPLPILMRILVVAVAASYCSFLIEDILAC